MPDFTPSFGRVEDQESVERFFSKQKEPLIAGAARELLAAADDNADVDLCLIYKSVTGRNWNSRNQNPRGFCVGFGNSKMATLSIAMMAHAGEIAWPGADVAIEPTYGGMRYEVGYKMHGSTMYRGDDGGVGSWAAEWLLDWGVLLMQKYDTVDFTSYDMNRCDRYGSRGVPDELEPIAKQHPLAQAALCQDGQEVWKLIGQLHPVVHCSEQGFSMQRNRDGTCRANDTWPHCSGWSGRFTLPSGQQVVRYDNSWDGDESGSGYLGDPITVPGKNGPINLNGNQFLVPIEVVTSMCREGKETFAMTGPRGFTQRRPLFMV